MSPWYKGEQSMERGSSVPHKQWGTILRDWKSQFYRD